MKGTTFFKIRTLDNVSEYRLKNGLRVLYRREKATPVVAICVTFHVGSRNEAKGHTGSTHILEHLLFKDSSNFNIANGKSITDYLDGFGALVNASTSLDRTNYYELVPRDYAPDALELEADRLRNSLFTENDLATEMTIVRNEYERTRNNPFELLDEAVTQKAFRKHPYRIPTIGTKEDIEATSARKLRNFYDLFYWPNNATLTIIGDIEWKIVRKILLQYFAPISKSPKTIPSLRVKEPRQTKSRFCKISKPFGVSIVSIAYKITAGTHDDYPALLLLSIMLAGGFSSLLQKILVDTGLAVSVYGAAYALHDPGLMTFMAQTVTNVEPKIVLKKMQGEISNYIRNQIPLQDVARAKERFFSLFASEHDGVLSEALSISEALAAGDWTLAYRMKKLISAVTVCDVERVARKYIKSNTETTGMLLNRT